MSFKGNNQLQPRTSKPSGIGPRDPTYVVGIGASAGGLESLERLFRHVSLDTGMAFVVVQHLSPDFKSMMSELLARSTSMRIQIAEDGMQVESNTLYLMPPKNEMLIADGRLHLLEKDTTRGVALPIDRFFESLAREYGERAIAIVLSGSGTDGTRGIAEISRCGGLVLSESLATAKFDGMPSSAQATGLVDVTVAPEEIGQLLLGYANDSDHILRTKASHGDQAAALVGIEAIYQLFRSVYDIDFASYKDSTVLRRIHRRLTMKQCDSVDQYVALLKAEPTELQSLYSDLLIGVTQFFRDPRVFEQLIKDVLPRLVSQCTRSQGVRAWVAGCATGEEAYSVAIAFREALRNQGVDLPVKLFATDIHRRSIEYASRGCYCTEALQHLATDLRERYFTQRSDGYQVRPEIRQMIVFSPHNVLRDAPFTGLDFVSCRNLLIYLRPAAQHRAITLFHYSLRVGGVMLLGGSETTGDLCKEFEAINERLRLYRKTRDVRLADHLRVPIETAKSLSVRPPLPSVLKPASASVYRTQEIHQQLHARFMPPAVLIDSTRCVLDTFAGAERLLRLPAGQPTFDILNLVDRQIRTSLSGAIGRAAKEQTVVQLSRLNMACNEGTHVVDLTVEPLVLRNDETLYLIVFHIVETAAVIDSSARLVDAKTSSDQQQESQKQIQQLEDDLRYSRENLQATIEELETSNEELQATNEELIASNEELQSTNEELHSLNEELYSVNAEYQRKIEELAELNRDMNLLLENTDVAMVFLDDKLQVRRFTSRVSEIFELIDDDIGRSISAFAAKLPIEGLADRLQTVLSTNHAFEQEVRSRHGQVYLMRLLPYHTGRGVGGIVMMWVDISSIESLRGRLRWLSAIVESTSDAIIGQQLDGTITSWNRGAEELYGYKADEIIGQPIDLLTPEDRKAETADYRQRIQRGETIHAIDTIRLNNKLQPIHVSLTVSPVVNSSGEAIGISKIARDISTRIRMEQEIREQVTQREYFLAMLSHELRNPFNAIHCASKIVADPRVPEDARQLAIQSISRQVSVVNHLLTDLLDVARIAENRINLHFEILDLRDLAVAVREMVQPEIDRHKCQLVFEFEEKPALVRGDRTRLIQVQVNLIHNAAKYSETDSPIEVKLACEGPDIHLSVSDQGRGIPLEQLDSIFKPFAQLDQSLARSDGGLGVGLTLAKSLVELHGGSICAESVGLGHGSTFHVRLPRADHHAIELSSQQLLAEAASSGMSNATSEARPRTTLDVCIIEDIDDSRELMKAILEIDGHCVRTASTGREAIELLTTQPMDLAIIDVGLPDISGYEVAQKVRSHVPRSCRLVALTGFCQPADVAEALQSGFDEHMVKPLDVERLEKIIALVAEAKSQRKSSAS